LDSRLQKETKTMKKEMSRLTDTPTFFGLILRIDCDFGFITHLFFTHPFRNNEARQNVYRND